MVSVTPRDLKLILTCPALPSSPLLSSSPTPAPTHSTAPRSPKIPKLMSFCKWAESIDCQIAAPLCNHLGFSSFKKLYAESIRNATTEVPPPLTEPHPHPPARLTPGLCLLPLSLSSLHDLLFPLCPLNNRVHLTGGWGQRRPCVCQLTHESPAGPRLVARHKCHPPCWCISLHSTCQGTSCPDSST